MGLMGRQESVAFLAGNFFQGNTHAKERNSGIILDEVSGDLQVQIVGAGTKLLSETTALASPTLPVGGCSSFARSILVVSAVCGKIWSLRIAVKTIACR
ncbi:MAG: hypothetical protein ACKV0T_02365 [Planctomycetales bacterium]